ncbi:MAG TPA: alpha-amylase family glycosyl hydrolase, partial [Candidatus Xenobia bacterium]
MAQTNPWWRTTAIYQVYPRSFQDSNGDGIGDLEGVRRRLPYLKKLGFGAFWLSPFYPSPQHDFGYDVSDYCDVDPQFGTLEDFGRLVTDAHALGLKVIVDLVPNHTSSEHPWFREARASRDNPKRNWYVWADPAKDGGPPNNWQSFFGGPAWTFHPTTGQYYLHHFLPEQPDLNYRNDDVTAAMLDVLRFWFRRGVDGFRIDVLWMLVDDVFLRKEPLNPLWRPGMKDRDRTIHAYTDDQPETHWVARKMRKVSEEYTDRVLIGEIYLPYEQLMAYYGTEAQPEVHMPFNFRLISDGVPHWTAGN